MSTFTTANCIKYCLAINANSTRRPKGIICGISRNKRTLILKVLLRFYDEQINDRFRLRCEFSILYLRPKSILQIIAIYSYSPSTLKKNINNVHTNKPRVSFIVLHIQSQKVLFETFHIVGLGLDTDGSFNSSFIPIGNQRSGTPAVGANPAEHARGVYALDSAHHAGYFLI